MAQFSFQFVILLICHSRQLINDFSATDASYAQYEPCEVIDHLENGRVKRTNGGTIIKFYCKNSFVLVGEKSAVCSFGKWTATPPICAKTNCPSLPELLYGRTKRVLNGAVLNFECNSLFVMQGSSKLVCLENGWNGSLPICQANSLPYEEICHFEPDHTRVLEETSCNWISKQTSAYNEWVITSSKQPVNEHNKRPSFDHTLAPHTGGYYLYLQNISGDFWKNKIHRDDGAKYISPMFPAIPTDEDWCLIFWLYSNYEHAKIMVNVFVNNETRWSNERLPKSNRWVKVIVSLRGQTTPFRITIEGNGYLKSSSNTAIDDLYFTNGTKCHDTTNVENPYIVEPTEYPDEYNDNDEEKTSDMAITNLQPLSHPKIQSSNNDIHSTSSTTAFDENETNSKNSTKRYDSLSTVQTNSAASSRAFEVPVTSKIREYPQLKSEEDNSYPNKEQDKIKPVAVQESRSYSDYQIMVVYLTVVILSIAAITTIYLIWERWDGMKPNMIRNEHDKLAAQNELVLHEVESIE